MHGEGGMKDKDGRLVVNEKDRRKLWKEHMEKILNVKNEWDQMAEADMVEGVNYEEVVKAINKMKLGKAAGPSKVNKDKIMASGKFGVGVIKRLCTRILDNEDMPQEWKTSVVVPIFKGRRDLMGCEAYTEVKLLKHAMNIVERVLENRIRGLVAIDDMQLGFMPGKGTAHTLSILRKIQKEFRVREKKLCMCFVDLEKPFDRIPRKMAEWALKKKDCQKCRCKQ